MASVARVTGVSVFGLMATGAPSRLRACCSAPGRSRPGSHPRAQGWGLVLLLFGLNAAFPLFTPLLAGKALTGSGTRLARTRAHVHPGTVRRVSRHRASCTSLGGQDLLPEQVRGGDTLRARTGGASPRSTRVSCAGSTPRPPRTVDRGRCDAGRGPDAPGRRACPCRRNARADRCHRPLAPGPSGCRAVPPPRWRCRRRGRDSGGDLHRRHHGRTREAAIASFRSTSPSWKMLGLYSTLALGLLLAMRPYSNWSRGRSEAGVGRCGSAIHLAIASVIRLPGASSFFTVDKFSYIVWIPLALTAVLGLERLWHDGARSRARRDPAALFLPVNGLAIARPHRGSPLRALGNRGTCPASPGCGRTCPTNAVLVLPYGDSVTGNYVGRDQYVIDENLVAQVLGYPVRELAARRGLAERFFATDSLDLDSATRLRSLGRPVYGVWARFADPRLAMAPRLWLDRRERDRPAGPPPPLGRPVPDRLCFRHSRRRRTGSAPRGEPGRRNPPSSFLPDEVRRMNAPGSPRPRISIVTPAFNEAASLPALHRRLREVLDPDHDWELLVVNDGSSDDTWERRRPIERGRPARQRHPPAAQQRPHEGPERGARPRGRRPGDHDGRGPAAPARDVAGDHPEVDARASCIVNTLRREATHQGLLKKLSCRMYYGVFRERDRHPGQGGHGGLSRHRPKRRRPGAGVPRGNAAAAIPARQDAVPRGRDRVPARGTLRGRNQVHRAQDARVRFRVAVQLLAGAALLRVLRGRALSLPVPALLASTCST